MKEKETLLRSCNCVKMPLALNDHRLDEDLRNTVHLCNYTVFNPTLMPSKRTAQPQDLQRGKKTTKRMSSSK